MNTLGLSHIARRSRAESRSISAENPTGERGRGAMAAPPAWDGSSWNPARELGAGWKVQPNITIPAGTAATIADIEGPGVICHIWITFSDKAYRDLVLRIYWDGQEHPSVESPLGDFFCNAWNARQNILALPINVNPQGGMNSYFPMPFRQRARITVENQATEDYRGFFYTVNYTLEPVDDDDLRFHAHLRRANPLPGGEVYTMIDGVRGQGQYVGAFMAWQQNNHGWWGEGEIKMFLDGDAEFPTICGTGTEDYFGGAWGFGDNAFSAPFLGFQTVSGKNMQVGARMTMYRFHIQDPVFFRRDLRVTMQALGWRSKGRYLPLQDDIASVVYWYQTLPHQPFAPLPDRNAREIV